MGYIETYEKYAKYGKYYGGVTNKKFPREKTEGLWFKPAIIWNLYRDNVLTKKEIFQCMTSDVRSPEELKARMIQKYPLKKELIIYYFN